MENGEFASVSEAFWMGRMLAAPFLGSIYFNSPFSILNLKAVACGLRGMDFSFFMLYAAFFVFFCNFASLIIE
jgi:hypothetical protein